MENTLKLRTSTWVLAYLISPALPFICLRAEKAVSTLECIGGSLCALLTHIGLISVLSKTNDDDLQVFVVLLLAVCLYLIVVWQYSLGHRSSLWSAKAEKYWRSAGIFFGIFISLWLLSAILSFHFITA